MVNKDFSSVESSIYDGHESMRDKKVEDVIWMFREFQRDILFEDGPIPSPWLT